MDAGLRTPSPYRLLDAVSGGLLLGMTVWAPWAFGCTVSWAIWTMCGAGYALGLLLAAKWFVRWRNGYTPARWVEHSGAGRWTVRALAGLTVLLLAYVFLSWINARANLELTELGTEIRYGPRPPLGWLPTTYDAANTLRAFWRYLALALTFWAARDWLLGRSRSERRAEVEAFFPPARLRWLLWTLCLSSSLLALVSIAQRFDGTDKLLWILKPARYTAPDFTWGPYTYRANGAQYFNLVWPVALGFWWALRRAASRRRGAGRRTGGDAHVVLLPCTMLMALCPLLAASRGGVLVMLGLLAGALAVLATAREGGGKAGRFGAVAVFLVVLLAGWFLGGEALKRRFATVFTDRMSSRLDVYEVADRMVADAGPFGTGAETFLGLYSLYRTKSTDPWHAFAHNDWLETRITFGWVGFTLVLGLLGLLPLNWRAGHGLRAPREFTLLLALSLAGALVHARFDFPFQMFSLLFLFLLLAAVGLATAGRAERN